MFINVERMPLTRLAGPVILHRTAAFEATPLPHNIASIFN
jgi:hypothetical protein